MSKGGTLEWVFYIFLFRKKKNLTRVKEEIKSREYTHIYHIYKNKTLDAYFYT